MNFDLLTLQETLPVMGQGMAGIFIVSIAIYLSVKLLSILFPAN